MKPSHLLPDRESDVEFVSSNMDGWALLTQLTATLMDTPKPHLRRELLKHMLEVFENGAEFVRESLNEQAEGKKKKDFFFPSKKWKVFKLHIL